MDRIILHFQQDEPVDDFNTACQVISPQNIIETELLLLVLKRAAAEHFNETKANEKTLLAVSLKLIKSKRPKQASDGLHLVSKIIYRNPTDSTVFLDAILARSLQMMRTQKYPLTRNDLRYYKSFPCHNMTPEGLVLVQTLLCSSLYYTREMHEARAELFQLETGLQILSDQIIRENLELYTFLMHLEKYKQEIREPSRNVQFRRKPKVLPYVPLRGFNLDRKIPGASDLCEYISEGDERGVYARKFIPKKSIVIVETGQSFQFSAPFMNCEMCGAYEENLYTCSECRAKCYCSHACLKYDWEEHQHECYGYKIGIIQMLEAKMLFRFFVQSAKRLSPALAAYTLQNGPIRNASVAWDFIIESARSYNRESRTIGEFLCRQPNMNLFTRAKWRQLVTIALRLAVFVHNDSNIPETFFDTLKLTKNDSIILYTSLFLRLSTHIVLNSQQNEMEHHYEMPEEDPVQEPQPQAMQRMNMNAFAFFSIFAHTDFVNSFKRVEGRIQYIKKWKPFDGLFARSRRAPTNVGSPMYEFCSKLLNVVITKKEIKAFNDLYNSDNALSPLEIEQHFENLNTSDRCTIIEEFARLYQHHIYDYFRNERRQEKTALCTTIKKVAHACDANTEIRVLRDGTYLAVTTKSLKPGTPLTISQSSVSHLRMSRAERRAYFQAIGTSCDCRACTGHPLKEPTNVRQAIYCAYCLTEVEITPLHGSCMQCNSNYHQFIQNYSKFVSCALEEIHFREKHRKTTQRELSCLYGMYHSYVTMHYAKGHEIRLSAIIIFIEHLIKKGFINHACDMIFALLDLDFSINTPLTRKEIEKKIFNLLRRVTQCYIDSFLNCDAMAVDTSYPKMLLYALKYMLRVQEKDFEIAIDDREEYSQHLAHYTEYYKWKIIINANLTMPLVLQRYLTEN